MIYITVAISSSLTFQNLSHLVRRFCLLVSGRVLHCYDEWKLEVLKKSHFVLISQSAFGAGKTKQSFTMQTVKCFYILCMISNEVCVEERGIPIFYAWYCESNSLSCFSHRTIRLVHIFHRTVGVSSFS